MARSLLLALLFTEYSYSQTDTLEGNVRNNCTPGAILEFPEDVFTREQRSKGTILLHVFFSCYLFTFLALVCDRYFVPSINEICKVFHIPDDVAGATLMAGATSSPELFINLVGTFVTKGDVGIGTVMGSAVFNILAVPASCALLATQHCFAVLVRKKQMFAGHIILAVIPCSAATFPPALKLCQKILMEFGLDELQAALALDWWPFTRECIMYLVSAVILIYTLEDGRVHWYEAMVMVIAYVGYIAGLCISPREKKLMNSKSTVGSPATDDEKSPLVVHTDQSSNICGWPQQSGVLSKVTWLFLWPINFLLLYTVPDCRSPKYQRYYWLTFSVCMLWIGSASYLTSWMITVVGDVLNIPDSVLGITFLAAGTSLPEAVSSVIVVQQGRGSMGISNSIGSNTFDILLCLGLPWFIKATFLSSDLYYVKMNSSGLQYTAILLLSTLLFLYAGFFCNKFVLNKKIGVISLVTYLAFLTVASLIEMNVFTQVNLPTCVT